jgi:hypothetical protein
MAEEMKWSYVVTGVGERYGLNTWDKAVEIAGNLIKGGDVVGIHPVPTPEALEEAITMTKRYPAKQWTGDNRDDVQEFIGDRQIETVMEHPVSGERMLYVHTSDGVRAVPQGSYLVIMEGSLEFFTAEDIEQMAGISVEDA